MKKISLFLSLICALGATAFVGCQKPVKENAYKLNGFESYDELRTIRMERCIGSMKVNRDEKYITDGSASMKFEIVKPSAMMSNGWITGTFDVGEIENNVTPCLNFAATTGCNKLNEISEFDVDIYSDNAFDCKLLFTAEDKTEKVVFANVINVNANSMNRIRIPISSLFNKEETEIAKYKLSFYGAPTAVFYIDGFKAVKGTREQVNVTDRTFGNILTFDSAEELGYLNYVCNTMTPSVQYTHNVDYAFSQNGYSLKMKAFTTDGSEYQKSDGTDANCRLGNGFEIASELLQKCEMEFAEKLLLDAFVDGNQTRNVVITAFDGETEVTKSFPISPYEWQTIEFADETLDLSKLVSLQIKLDTLLNERECDVYLDGLRYE